MDNKLIAATAVTAVTAALAAPAVFAEDALYGSLLVGRQDTPMTVSFYGSGGEIAGGSGLDLSLGSGLEPGRPATQPIGVFPGYRTDNGIAYSLPNLAGFTLAAAVLPAVDDRVTPAADRDGIADHFALGAVYAGGGLKASAGYQETPGTADLEQKTLQLGASYTVNALSVGAQYEDTRNLAFGGDVDYSAWALTAKATFGSSAITAVYTDAEKEDRAGLQSNTVGWGLAAEHSFSRRTKVYVAFSKDEDDSAPGDADTAHAASLGMIHNF